VANGVVYAGSFDGSLYALNAATGTKLWSFATGLPVDSSPAVANGVV
jgi:outer membrane protein assembly factor BamB